MPPSGFTGGAVGWRRLRVPVVVVVLVALAAPTSIVAFGATHHAASAPTLPLGRSVSMAVRTAGAPPPLVPGTNPWENLTGELPTAPSARNGAMMTYDVADGYLLLFGGISNNGSVGDTWKFTNHTWTNLTGTTGPAPPSRFKGGMVYDTADGYVLLFGGQAGGNVYYNDTWKFSGGKWTELAATNAPSPREDAMMAYDVADGYVLLFGGEKVGFVYSNDTWTYHAGNWTNISHSITVTPPKRESGTIAYDPIDHEVVLYGGKPTETSTMGDTWTYAGGVWTNRTASLTASPGPREGGAMTYDAADGYLLLFGGLHYPNTLNDTWAFAGNAWTLLSPGIAPPTMFDSAITYDPASGLGEVILFGGQLSAIVNHSSLSVTWSYKVPLTATISVTPAVIDAGQNVSISATILGGYAPYNWSWLGLPGTCAPGSGTTFTCAPTTLGNFSIAVNASDGSGASNRSLAMPLTVHPLPSVNATDAGATGLVPLTVQFDSTTSGGTSPFSISWTFGDSGTATGANPKHTYTSTGTFTAKVTVVDATGATASAVPAGVDVVGPLSVAVSAAPHTGIAPLTVDFTATPTGGLGPYTYAWSFGVAGATATGATASYSYLSAGNFTAYVNVTDSLGDTSVNPISISTIEPLAASFTYTLGAPACILGVSTQIAQFVAIDQGGSGGYDNIWTFPNASFNDVSIVRYPVIAGTDYQVEMIVTDSANDTTTFNATIPASDLTGTNCATTSGTGSTTFPWLYVLIAIISIAVALELVVMFRRSRRSPPTPPPAPPAAPPVG